MNIGGGVFTGYFNDDLFYITSRRHKENEDQAEAAANPTGTPCDISAATPAAPQGYLFEDRIPPWKSSSMSKRGWYTTRGVIFPATPSSNENQPDRTLQQFWADAGTKVDNDGFIYLSARKKEIIKVRGKRVSPKEIEAVILEIPEVVDCSVEGIEDELQGEALKATIILNKRVDDSVSEELIKHHCSQYLSLYKIPHIYEIKDQIAISATGKKIKEKL